MGFANKEMTHFETEVVLATKERDGSVAKALQFLLEV